MRNSDENHPTLHRGAPYVWPSLPLHHGTGAGIDPLRSRFGLMLFLTVGGNRLPGIALLQYEPPLSLLPHLSLFFLANTISAE